MFGCNTPSTAEICVRDLPPQICAPLLTELLIQFGPLVDCARVAQDPAGGSKGLAFAEYADFASAQYAINVLNGFRFAGKDLRVSFSHRSSHLLAGSSASGQATDATSRPFKIIPCKYFAQGVCRFGQQCTFAHGEYEEQVNKKRHLLEMQQRWQANAQALELQMRQKQQEELEEFKQQQQQQMKMRAVRQEIATPGLTHRRVD